MKSSVKAESMEFNDRLMIEGVNFKGFGIIPYFVMRDAELTVEAKSIYLYLASFAGNGMTAFPSRDKIFRDLHINKDTYYKHYKQLIDQGYIVVRQSMQERSRFSRNIYTIVSNPKKLQFSKNILTKETGCLEHTGLKVYGYGTIPKAVMIDPRLSIKAKCVYGYFSSLTGAGNIAFPQLKQILHELQLSMKSYHKYINELISLNYVAIRQRRINGRMSINDYYLIDTPNCMTKQSPIGKISDTVKGAESPVGKISDTVKAVESPIGKISDTAKAVESPIGKISDTLKPDTLKPDTLKPDTNITNIKNTNIIHSFYNSQGGGLPIGEGKKDTNSILEKVKEELLTKKQLPYYYKDNEQLLTTAIHFMTNWEQLSQFGYQDELHQCIYKLFNEALIQMCMTDQMQLRGSHVTYAKVIDRLNERAIFEDGEVDLSDLIDSVVTKYYNATMTTKIKNPMKYMQACIWDLLLTGNIEMYASLSRDFGIESKRTDQNYEISL